MISNSILIKNCKLFNELNDKPKDILIESGRISKIESNIQIKSDQLIDARERIVSPGLIDVHIQGAGGADILDNSIASLQTISKTLSRIGTTSYLGTTVVKPEENNQHLRLAKEYINKKMGGSVLLGFHLEGPFINIQKKGGLDPSSIYASSDEKLDEILEITDNTLRMMTIAPELPGNLKIIKRLVENNVIASFAHSNATYEETKKGFDAGINHVTHIFNAMPSLHHRNPGPIAAIFENKNITVQIISDGHHIHPSIIKMIYHLIGNDRSICITDGMHGIGLRDGNYFYNKKEYISKNGAARYLDGTLIGSTTSLLNIVLKFKEFTGCSLEHAVNTASLNPAKLLKIDNCKGSLKEGKDADLIILDNDYSVFATFVEGELVYRKSSITHTS